MGHPLCDRAMTWRAKPQVQMRSLIEKDRRARKNRSTRNRAPLQPTEIVKLCASTREITSSWLAGTDIIAAMGRARRRASPCTRSVPRTGRPQESDRPLGRGASGSTHARIDPSNLPAEKIFAPTCRVRGLSRDFLIGKHKSPWGCPLSRESYRQPRWQAVLYVVSLHPRLPVAHLPRYIGPLE